MWFFGLLLFLFLIASLIKPWLHGTAIRRLEENVRDLESKIYSLERMRADPVSRSASSIVIPRVNREFKAEPEPIPVAPILAEAAPKTEPLVEPQKPEELETFPPFEEVEYDPKDYAQDYTTQETETQPRPAFNFEQQFGAKLPVWIGGISLALAGFFMVKYSIENQLVSPTMRVIFAIIFGLGLLGAGRWVFMRPAMANGVRICQSLTGAGLVCLYGAFFAAGTLYELVSPTVSFFGMVGVTIAAVILSISQGPAVAIFGMVGGFLTPIMVSTDNPSTLLLMLYLSALSFGLLYLARRQNWLWLSLPVYAFSLLWAVMWVLGSWNAAEAIFVSLYVIALMFITPFMLFRRDTQDQGGTPHFISYGGSIVSIAILSVITAKADFSSLHWSTFGLAGLASITLAVFRPRLYAFAPAVCAAVTGFMLVSWQAPDMVTFLQTALLFAAVYFAASCALMFRVENPVWWSKIAVLTLPFTYVVTYLKYEYAFNVTGNAFIPPWAWLALIVASVSTGLTILMQQRFDDTLPSKQRLLGLSALLALGFLSWGLYLTLDTKYLMIAYALQTLGIAWLLQKYTFGFIRGALVVATFLLGISFLPYYQQLFSLISMRDLSLQMLGRYPSFPIMPIAATALLLFGAGYMNIEQKLKKALLLVGGVLGLCVLYAAINNALGPVSQGMFPYTSGASYDAPYYLRVLSLNVTWLLAIGALWAGIQYSREALRLSAVAMMVYAYVQTVVVDLIIFMPDRNQMMGAMPIFNLLIPAFALPMIYMYKSADHFIGSENDRYATVLRISALAYLFLFVTLETSHFYHAPVLSGVPRTLAEIYTYSVVWLLTGLSLLFWGTMRHSRLLRISGLVVVTGTVCKVFLYDASELDGLLRVLSFLGLGVSLMGLSYFYTRFVVARDRDDT